CAREFSGSYFYPYFDAW
nr:immunoglobulin heavy chain junction region [Macaca mulatta]MOV38084.1 immunoglobulin heavy chain junction region [Macaca mulatta]MOV38138.1 immunoglobulin heavy chain junction region [Macaca mulatta]MOV38345.1 immunoglobulin heavy chain junction region [Macaca mulatta]MOV38441.1 immunoglobulin heavy chain junction region [Macaca mulatta]